VFLYGTIMIYKPLTFSDHQTVSDQMYDFVINHTDIMQTQKFWNAIPSTQIVTLLQYVPALKMFFGRQKFLPQKAEMAIICAVPGHATDYLHVDGGNPADVRVIWPIKNCAGSKTTFWKVESQYIKPSTNEDVEKNGSLYYEIADGPHEQIDFFELTRPMIFDSNVPHSIKCNPDITEPRLSFTIGILDQADPRRYSVEAWYDNEKW